MIRAATRLLVLAVLALVAMPGSAMANPISDCNDDGDLDKNYTNGQLRKAIETLPTDLDEYSNCREILSGAITAASDKGGGRPSTSTGAGGAPLTPEDEAARAHDTQELEAITADPEKNPPTVEVGDTKVEPGSNGLFDLASASNDLPVPLLIALIALALVAIIGGLLALRERFPALARIPLLSKIPTPRVSLPRFWR